MKRLSVFLTAAGLTLAGIAQGEVVPISIFNTGVDALGISQPNGTTPDLHYSLISAPGSPVPAVLVQTSVGGFPVPPWLHDSTTSAWIGPLGTAPAGDYIYQTTFDLSGLDPATAILSGQWATDNSGTILLNGASTGVTESGFAAFAAFSINGGFVDGANTLDFVVNNAQGDGGNPTGLRVEVSGTADVATPEPASFALIGLGLAGLGLMRRRSIIKFQDRISNIQEGKQ